MSMLSKRGCRRRQISSVSSWHMLCTVACSKYGYAASCRTHLCAHESTCTCSPHGIAPHADGMCVPSHAWRRVNFRMQPKWACRRMQTAFLWRHIMSHGHTFTRSKHGRILLHGDRGTCATACRSHLTPPPPAWNAVA